MKRIAFWLALLTALSCTATAQLHSMSNAEYFFDVDPGPGNGTALAIIPGDTAAITGSISTAGLTAGVHVLHIRMQRDDGVWGAPTRRMIRIGISSTFDQAEVFFNTDPGPGNGTALAISESGVINETAFDVPDIGRGFQTMNVRCRSNGTWSAPARRTLRLGSAWIDGAEVYFDTDPGEGHGIPVDVGFGADVAALDSTVSVAAAGTGVHTAYLRFRGGDMWSFPKFQTIRVGLWVDGGVNRITAGEFFVDTDPGAGNGCPLIAEDGAYGETDEAMRRYLSGTDLGIGAHVIGVRARDGGGRWYNTVRDTVKIIEAHLVAGIVADSTGRHVKLAWDRYPAALAYHVRYDSVATGAFTNYLTVMPPDTSVEYPATQARRFYKVVALQVDPEPCGSQSAAIQDHE